MPFDRTKTSLEAFPKVSNITAIRLLEQAAIAHCITVEVHGSGSSEAAQSSAELGWTCDLVFQQNHKFFVPREEGVNQPRPQASREMAERVQSEFRRQLDRLGVTIEV